MCVKVLLAEDAELVAKAIHVLLSECEDITLVGDAATFSEAVQKAEQLSPDVIVLDLHMADGAKQHLPAGAKLLAISFANDNEAKASAESIGASKLLDKMELANELIPAILELAPAKTIQRASAAIS
jgi:two-component system, NarL family, response regulator DevR